MHDDRQRERLRFIDLFAGLGGFHQALASLGHECVFASEIDPELSDLYEKNFGLRPHGDIRDVKPADIPTHDVLCAGFPCQNYSKAGEQLGLDCPKWGDLIDYIVKVLNHHKSRMLIMENVPNLMRHEGGETWRGIREKLVRAGYFVSEAKLSPDMFGVPQTRERAFIVGRREGLGKFGDLYTCVTFAEIVVVGLRSGFKDCAMAWIFVALFAFLSLYLWIGIKRA